MFAAQKNSVVPSCVFVLLTALCTPLVIVLDIERTLEES